MSQTREPCTAIGCPVPKDAVAAFASQYQLEGPPTPPAPPDTSCVGTPISCPVPNDAVQDFANQYQLENIVVTNTPFQAIINGVPITIPPGTITIPFPQTPFPSFITYQGCLSTISLPIPVGSTPKQVQAIVQEVAQLAAAQQAQCNAGPIVPVLPTFTNAQQTFVTACTVALPLTITVSLPQGITQDGNNLVLAAGIFISNVSQADADTQALNFLTVFTANLFTTGAATCGAAGCNDTEILTNTTANFSTGGGTYDITVADAFLFVADSTTPYVVIQKIWDGTGQGFVVNTIIDPFTINITENIFLGVQGIPSPSGPVLSGAPIYISAAWTYITHPPVITAVQVMNWQSQILPLLDNTCSNPNCTSPGPDWDGSLPILDLSFGFQQFGYEQGSDFGGTDMNVFTNGVNSFFLEANAGTTSGFWRLTIQCSNGSNNIFVAYKFGGKDATGVYYFAPGTCLYPLVTTHSCLVVVAA